MKRKTHRPLVRWSPAAASVLTGALLTAAPAPALSEEVPPPGVTETGSVEAAAESPAPSEPEADLAAQSAAPAAAPAATPGERQLEKRVNELEETVRLLKEELKAIKEGRAGEKPAPAAPKPGAPAVTTPKAPQGSPGSGPAFQLPSADGKGRIAFRGWVQGGLRLFPSEFGRSGLDQFFLRRVRPSIDASLNPNVGFRISPDFSSFGTSLLDAYMDLRLNPSMALRAGKFKEPLSLERLQTGADFLTIERSLANNLAPNRDVGVQLFGELFDRRASYQIAVFNGVPDGVSAETDTDSDKDFAGRVFAHPFRSSGKKTLEGLGVGMAATIGKRDDGAAGTYRTAARAPFFSLASGGVSDGTHLRLAPQMYYYHGPFGFQAEHYTSRQGVRRGAARDVMHNRGWYSQTSYVLTGEKASFERVVPKHPFDPQQRHWGAWELAFRWSELHMDPDVFDLGIANRTTSAEDAHAFTFGLNWHLTSALKLQVNYERTAFGRAILIGSRPRDHENLVLGQVQIVF